QAHLLQAARGGARLGAAEAVAAHPRPLAAGGQPHARLRPFGFRCRLRDRAAGPAAASGGGGRARRAGPAYDPPARVDAATRLAVAFAAVARPGRLPTARLAAVGPAGGAQLAR